MRVKGNFLFCFSNFNETETFLTTLCGHLIQIDHTGGYINNKRASE